MVNMLIVTKVQISFNSMECTKCPEIDATLIFLNKIKTEKDIYKI